MASKELIVFDMDGTLTPSKSIADKEMVSLLLRLLEKKKVAVIGGGKYALFKEQLMTRMPRNDKRLENLFLFPTTANAFYRYERGWKNVYLFELPKRDRAEIIKSFKEVLKEIRYVPPQKTYGQVIEDRKTQVTFSALGQEIVARLGLRGVRMKEEWTKKNKRVKLRIAKLMQERLPHLEVHAAGFTSIDITKKGIDKAYGVRQIKKYLHIPIAKMVFIGDALFPGGNDYAAKRTGIQCIAVRGPEDTKKVIKKILAKT